MAPDDAQEGHHTLHVLEPRLVNVEIHPVDALHLQGHMIGENISGASGYGHDGLRSTQALCGHPPLRAVQAGPSGPASRLDRSLRSSDVTRHRCPPLLGDLPQPPQAGTDVTVTTTPLHELGLGAEP